MRRALLIGCGMLIVSALPLKAQSCWYSTETSSGQLYCNAVLDAAKGVQPAIGIALAGGNPVPGANSTLGMRIGSIPRISISARASGAFTDLPSIQRASSSGSDNTLVRSIDLDAAVGLLSGWTVAPTIGGVGSFDIVGSIGKAGLPDEFTQSPGSFALGARMGLLRESFTMPGVSVTAMTRWIGDVRYGNATLTNTDATFELTDNQVFSFRAVAGKRLFVLGANAGIGWDEFRAKPQATVRNFTTANPMGTPREFKTTRFTAFGNVTWTALIVNAVIEGGYQRGSGTQDNTYYGSLAVRLAL